MAATAVATEQADYRPFQAVQGQLIHESTGGTSSTMSWVKGMAVPDALIALRDKHINDRANIPYIIKEDKLKIKFRADGRPDKLGSGGFGWVYSGKYDSANCALKIVRLRDCTEYGLKTALKEVQSLQSIHYDYVVRLYGYMICLTEQQSFVCVVTELLEEDLCRAISKKKHMLTSSDSGIRILRHVAYGIRHLHSKGLIHRDIKSSNIFITRVGKAKIGDLGLTHQEFEDSGRGYTSSYASPEQLQGKICTSSTDIYSVGLVIYEMCTGKSAKGARTPDLESTLGIPDAIRSLVAKCRSENPGLRPSADELVSILEQVCINRESRNNVAPTTPARMAGIGGSKARAQPQAPRQTLAEQLKQAMDIFSIARGFGSQSGGYQRLVSHLTRAFPMHYCLVVHPIGSFKLEGKAVAELTVNAVWGWPSPFKVYVFKSGVLEIKSGQGRISLCHTQIDKRFVEEFNDFMRFTFAPRQ